MPDFIYTARTLQGEDVSGKMTANTKRDVLDALARQSVFAMTVEDAKKGHIEIKLFQGRAPESLIASTLQQLAELLENGVAILAAFQVIVRQTKHARLKQTLSDIHDRVSDGEAIDSAFAAYPKVFNALTISIIRAGVEGAFLEDSLKRVAKFLDEANEMKSRIIGAMIYPAILSVVGVTLVFVLLTVFVPKFQPMFDLVINNGKELPAMTNSLIEGNKLIKAYGLYALGGFGVLAFWLYCQLTTPWGRKLLDRLKLKVPIMGEIWLNSAVAGFCRVLGTLLANGVPILKSLEISSQSTGNLILAEAITKAAESVSSGESISKPLNETGIMPPQIMAMISVAEESNALETVLVNAADTIERKVARKLDILVRLVEPLMLLIMGSAVLYIIIALLLPIFSMDITM
ncbi:MAG: type II secretion system F family protein [Planctomycetaceae bacterium]|jgi:general secretion pathway protein F/type IV pilus assembly protein PilC|nr:type II secretion system F family protein [Planctomycetaceae bacterium]